MDEDQEATAKIEKLAIALGQEVLKASVSIEGAMTMWCTAMRLAHRSFMLGLFAPAFTERAAENRQNAQARQAEADSHAKLTLEAQLSGLGIDHEPITVDAPALRVYSADDQPKTNKGMVDE